MSTDNISRFELAFLINRGLNCKNITSDENVCALRGFFFYNDLECSASKQIIYFVLYGLSHAQVSGMSIIRLNNFGLLYTQCTSWCLVVSEGLIYVLQVINGYVFGVLVQLSLPVVKVGSHTCGAVLFILTVFVFLDEDVPAHHIKHENFVWFNIFTDAMFHLFLSSKKSEITGLMYLARCRKSLAL